MSGIKFFALSGLITLAVLSASACSGGTEETAVTGIEDAAGARDAAIAYLNEKYPDDAPAEDIEWEEVDATPEGLVGSSATEFLSDDWTVEVTAPVVAPENIIYTVTVSSLNKGYYWKGTVGPNGAVTEDIAFQKITEENSRKLAEEFVKNSPTFSYDGIEETLELTDTLVLRCPYCWAFVFEFDSRTAGYGNRSDMMTAQVITHHEALITVIQYEITSAVMDKKWDMRWQTEISDSGKPVTISALTVKQILDNPVYDTKVTIQGEVSLLGELLCPCFELTSEGETVQVWYGLMVENDGTERPALSVEGLENGDRVMVIGELKGEGGTHYSKGDFWASWIIKIPSASDISADLFKSSLP